MTVLAFHVRHEAVQPQTIDGAIRCPLVATTYATFFACFLTFAHLFFAASPRKQHANTSYLCLPIAY
jgi:hypothetical protein